MAALKILERSKGPAYTISQKVLQFCSEHHDRVYSPGEKISYPSLTPQFGLRLDEAKAVKKPNDEDHGLSLEDFLALSVTADAKEYELNRRKQSKELEKNLNKWIVGELKDYIKIVNYEIIESDEASHKVSVVVVTDQWIVRDQLGKIIESPFFDEVWNFYMDDIITEGVCYIHGKVSVKLRDDLRKHITDLAVNSMIDYHPNSNDIVRDLVHPALYPYIKGVSKLKTSETQPPASDQELDFWSRPYEDSKFQWLPTPFNIAKDGKCTIGSYINNLNRDKFPELYFDLENLFETFLPYFEEVWAYAKAIKFFKGINEDSDDEDEEEYAEPPLFEKEEIHFKELDLQVIVKIVDYTLQPGQAYEGVWHAEGMSHENIVMTGLYFLDRDQDITGGDLKFKRAFTIAERNRIFWNIPQDRTLVVNDFAEEGFVPLGKFPTEEGYLLVFPNCHIHKISKMVNTAVDKSASRRVVVFFVISPEKKIISTIDVPAQQDVISLSNAKQYRLELMAERKYNKEKLNIRDIELCEH